MENNVNSGMSRSSRNSKLYRQVYGKYQDLDNLPLEDNTDEIDIDSLKQLLEKDNNKTRIHRDEFDFIDTRKRENTNEKVRDINKLLEKARYENKKTREPEDSNIINNSRSILETLGTGDYEGNYLKKDVFDTEEKTIVEPKANLEMTREMKNLTRNIAISSLSDQVDSNSDLSLDLLSDLKPTNNTIVTEPIKEKVVKNEAVVESEGKKKEEVKKEDTKSFKKVKLESNGEKVPKIKKVISDSQPFFPMNTSDTTDIDIIKPVSQYTKEGKKIDKDFFTSSYEFSRKDFVFDDEGGSGAGNVLKIILLIMAICAFAGVIVYFVLNYGIKK